MVPPPPPTKAVEVYQKLGLAKRASSNHPLFTVNFGSGTIFVVVSNVDKETSVKYNFIESRTLSSLADIKYPILFILSIVKAPPLSKDSDL
jgi:hypothetical protein